MNHYITQIEIEELRHLSDICIDLKPDVRTNLLLTGKNGSGKTTVLQALFQEGKYILALHIGLQKTILPFLTSFFPKIQFIVSTHSPYILNSIENCVIYDLEKKIRMEDMSRYSAKGIGEGYYGRENYIMR